MLIIKNLNVHNPANSKEILLSNVNLSLDSNSYKRVALIGPNGSGKTTFIKTILSKNKQISINQEKIAYLPQHSHIPENITVQEIFQKEIDSQSEAYKIEILQEQLSLSPEILQRTISQLSGGQLLKIRLIRLLLQDPTILILDEPTNHLDQNSKVFLSNFIQNFPGSVLLVSHDRNFLQQTINQVWSIQTHTKTIDVFTGSYSDWRDKQDLFTQKNNHSFKKLQSEIKNIQKWLQANQNHPKYKFSAIVSTKQQKLKKLKKEFQEMNQIKNPKLTLSADKQGNSYKSQLLLNYNFQNHPILKNLAGKIYNNDKILLQGQNGSGKTTFLNFLKQESDNIIYNKSLQIAYITQIPKYDQNQTVQQLIHNHTQLNTTQIYQKMAQLNLKQLLKNKLKDLSGGEQKRLQIAILLSQKADIYLLDEPTNHLDIYTQEILQKFLKDLQKPFILVSHDKFLKDDLKFTKTISLLID